VRSRVRKLIEELGMAPHPEGGHFTEIYRSPSRVTPADGRGERPAVTTIYFLLSAGERARWHCVESDELWHFCEGAPLDLHCIDPETWEAQILRLGPQAEGISPIHVIRAGCWQAACTTGGYTLAGCTVAPGFEYRDYRIFGEESVEAEELRRRFPGLARFL